MKHLKTWVPSVLALTLPLAAAAHRGGDHFDQGFYFGGSAGISNLTAEINQSLVGTTFILNEGFFSSAFDTGYFDTSFHSDSTRGMGQLQLGYALSWGWFFGALEVSVNGSQLNLDQDNVATEYILGPSQPPIFDNFQALETTITSDIDIALNNFEPVADLKLGFTLPTKTYLYGRVGAAFNTIEVHDSVTFTQFFFDYSGNHKTIPQSFRTSESKDKVALRFGVGIEHKFFDQVSVALDYVHTEYGSVSVSNFEDTIIFGTSERSNDFQFGVSDEVDLTRDVVTLGVNYYFW